LAHWPPGARLGECDFSTHSSREKRCCNDWTATRMWFASSETVNLRLDQLQSRQNHWVIVDMIGKGGRLRTVPVAIVSSIVVPIPALSKTAWMRAFWPEPISVFGSSMLTMPVAVHICWTYHSARPSHRLDAGSVRKPLTGLPLSRPTEGPCLGSSRAAVISYADAE
jgi:hypothetical protein